MQIEMGTNVVVRRTDSTARTLTNEQGSVFGSDTETVQGASFPTPIMSDIVALMIEANLKLGYRAVQ